MIPFPEMSETEVVPVLISRSGSWDSGGAGLEMGQIRVAVPVLEDAEERGEAISEAIFIRWAMGRHLLFTWEGGRARMRLGGLQVERLCRNCRKGFFPTRDAQVNCSRTCTAHAAQRRYRAGKKEAAATAIECE